MKKISVIIFLFNIVLAQRPAPGPEQLKSIIITNVTIHIGNGKVIENRAVSFQNGKIKAVIDYSKTNLFDKEEIVIDGKKQHLYPGFILANTQLGLTEIDQLRPTRDFSEVGEIKAEIRTISSYNTDSRIIPTLRTNGILVAQPTPMHGLISGNSAVVHLDAWNWEDAAIKMEDGLHINWPSKNIYVWGEQYDINEIIKERDASIYLIKDIFHRAIQYNKDSQKIYNGKLEGVLGVFTGEKNLYIHADTEKDIIESVTFFESLGIKKIVLVGASESIEIIDFIKSHQLSLILDRIHSIPNQSDDDIHLPYKLPKILSDAGVLFTVSYTGDMETMGARNLPFTAGTAVNYGLDKEKAIQMITLDAAKILGIDGRLGTIEVGKDATLFISSGDALDMMTNNVTDAYINGRKVELKNSQQDLYEMYMDKYKLTK